MHQSLSVFVVNCCRKTHFTMYKLVVLALALGAVVADTTVPTELKSHVYSAPLLQASAMPHTMVAPSALGAYAYPQQYMQYAQYPQYQQYPYTGYNAYSAYPTAYAPAAYSAPLTQGYQYQYTAPAYYQKAMPMAGHSYTTAV